MEVEKTRVTRKFQATIPRRIRKQLGIKGGDEVFWHTVKEFILVDTHKKISNPVGFLTSQIRVKLDAVKLVNKARAKIA